MNSKKAKKLRKQAGLRIYKKLDIDGIDALRIKAKNRYKDLKKELDAQI